MNAHDVLDPDVVERLRQLTPPGEPDVLAEIFNLFLDDVPKRIDALRSAVLSGDAVKVQRTAHSLKGSSGNIGARAMHEVCRQIDERAKDGDLARVQSLLERLTSEYVKVEAELKRLLGDA